MFIKKHQATAMVFFETLSQLQHLKLRYLNHSDTCHFSVRRKKQSCDNSPCVYHLLIPLHSR
ncbi:hypothetical protein Hanom_Chr09g00777911 [Helianthus anomalus]